MLSTIVPILIVVSLNAAEPAAAACDPKSLFDVQGTEPPDVTDVELGDAPYWLLTRQQHDWVTNYDLVGTRVLSLVRTADCDHTRLELEEIRGEVDLWARWTRPQGGAIDPAARRWLRRRVGYAPFVARVDTAAQTRAVHSLPPGTLATRGAPISFARGPLAQPRDVWMPEKQGLTRIFAGTRLRPGHSRRVGALDLVLWSPIENMPRNGKVLISVDDPERNQHAWLAHAFEVTVVQIVGDRALLRSRAGFWEESSQYLLIDGRTRRFRRIDLDCDGALDCEEVERELRLSPDGKPIFLDESSGPPRELGLGL